MVLIKSQTGGRNMDELEKEKIYIKNKIEEYNSFIDEVSKKITQLKIDSDYCNPQNGKVGLKELYELQNNLSVVNNSKSRKKVEDLLKEIIMSYSYVLELMLSK